MAKTVDKYWRDREDINIISLVEADEEISREIRRLQLQSMDDIQDKIDGFYGRYAEKEGMTIAGSRRRVTKADINKLATQAKKDVAKKNMSNRANEEMSLYNLTMKTNRLEYLKAQINMDLVGMTEEERKVIEDKLTGEYMRETKRQSGIMGMTFGKNNTRKKIEAVARASFKGNTWDDLLWNNTDGLRSEVERLLTNSIVQGINPKVLARDLRKKFDSSIYNSERLMRTESARVQGEAFKDSMEEAGIEEYIFIAQPTGACDICNALDGEVFTEKQREIGVNMYPIHPNCRCATAMYVDREEWEQRMDDLGLVDGDGAKKDAKEDSVGETDAFNLNTSTKGDLSPRSVEGIENTLAQSPQEIKDMWREHEENMFVANSKSTQGFYRSKGEDKGIHFNERTDMDSETRYRTDDTKVFGRKNHTTYFHEFGHNIDDLLGKTVEVKEKVRLGRKTRTIMVERKQYASKELGLANLVKEEVSEMVNGYEVSGIGELLEVIGPKIQDEYPSSFSGVSDIFSGASGGFSNMGFHHPVKYWSKKNYDALGKETFAHMFQSYTMQDESHELMGKTFPKSYKLFQDFIKGGGKQ